MERKNFVNFTNHPSDRWSKEQTNAAEEYGPIVDVQFPEVAPDLTKEEVALLASDYVSRIMDIHPAAVLCQGEFTLCYAVINELKERGVKVLAACSRRIVEDTDTGKITVFIFEGFREY